MQLAAILNGRYSQPVRSVVILVADIKTPQDDASPYDLVAEQLLPLLRNAGALTSLCIACRFGCAGFLGTELARILSGLPNITCLRLRFSVDARIYFPLGVDRITKDWRQRIATAAQGLRALDVVYRCYNEYNLWSTHSGTYRTVVSNLSNQSLESIRLLGGCAR